MSDPETSPSQPVINSQSSFANDPLLLLLQPKALHLMSQDEIRDEVTKLRTLRTGSQSLGRALKQDAAERKVKEARAVSAPAKLVSLDDLLGGLAL